MKAILANAYVDRYRSHRRVLSPDQRIAAIGIACLSQPATQERTLWYEKEADLSRRLQRAIDEALSQRKPCLSNYAARCCEALPSPRTNMRLIPPCGNHLDADTLAAFAERSLLKDEKEAVFAHLAECERCRECLRVNGELKEFKWNACSPPHKPARSLQVSCFAAIAAGFALALWLSLASQFSRSHTPPRTFRPALHAAPKFSMQAPLWGAAPFQKLSTNERLAVRNSHRFSNEVSLATVSFRADSTAEFRTPGFSQIRLETALGERSVSVFLPLTIYK